MNNSIFIPRRINVGFQKRNDTYTQMLAYVIYYDEKGKLRKEASWESWRDKSIASAEYDNKPTEGFVLNKKVGGYRGDWAGFRQAYVRVYDPRGFEFEITVPNLLYILENTSAIKGKGLEGEFVYGWDGTDLVLIPTSSPDYIDLTKLNEKRFSGKTIKAKDLKIGATYLTRDNKRTIYMGHYGYYDTCYKFDGKNFTNYYTMNRYAESVNKDLRTRTANWSYKNNYETGDGLVGKRHWFYCDNYFFAKSSIPQLIETISEDPVENYSELFEMMEHNPYYSPYDKTKDTYTPVTIDEVRDWHSNGKHWKCYLAKIDDVYTRVELIKADNGVKLQRNDTWDATGKLDIFSTSIDDLFEKIELYHKDLYLTNGKFYRREI